MPDFFLFQKGSIHHQQQPGERERRHRPFPSTIRLKCIKDYFSEKVGGPFDLWGGVYWVDR